MIISVEDSGIGISEEDLTKLFMVFGKIEAFDEIRPSGIGLGLTLCNERRNRSKE